MTRGLLRLTPALLVVAACTEEAPAGGPAAECAEVVGVYRDLQRPVGIRGEPVQTSEGGVEISYEGMDGMNIPAEGTATCRFAVGGGGALTLLSAVVDDSPLDAEEVESVRAELGKPR